MHMWNRNLGHKTQSSFQILFWSVLGALSAQNEKQKTLRVNVGWQLPAGQLHIKKCAKL